MSMRKYMRGGYIMCRKTNAKHVGGLLGALLVLFMSCVAFAQPPLQDHMVYGTVYVNGVALTAQDTDYTVTTKVNDFELASYTMGDYGPNDNYYYLIIHLTRDLNDTNKGHIDESALVYVNGQRADIYDAAGSPVPDNAIILADGKMELLDLYVTTGIPVPDVIGMSEADADAEIIRTGLTVGQKIHECSNDVPAGHVIRTEPEANSTVAADTEIVIYVSSGVCDDDNDGVS
ncbi:PASTA domain-containing protein, partial [bacterium]|nr:PASTA domain-containing protein [bacterium]